ncbi:hypothetical protein MSPP1_003323 [Malassezia sp. CBS 17886]|nr:hypothetical protein MSPP1_003323 [Malassezia sp. CBS 17886]
MTTPARASPREWDAVAAWVREVEDDRCVGEASQDARARRASQDARALRASQDARDWFTRYFDAMPSNLLRIVGATLTPEQRAAVPCVRQRRRYFADTERPEELSVDMQLAENPGMWTVLMQEGGEGRGGGEDDEEDEGEEKEEVEDGEEQEDDDHDYDHDHHNGEQSEGQTREPPARDDPSTRLRRDAQPNGCEESRTQPTSAVGSRGQPNGPSAADAQPLSTHSTSGHVPPLLDAHGHIGELHREYLRAVDQRSDAPRPELTVELSAAIVEEFVRGKLDVPLYSCDYEERWDAGGVHGAQDREDAWFDDE